jgi:hypothetical protein
MNSEKEYWLHLLKHAWKHRLLITFTAVFSGVLSFYLTLPHIKKPEYKATAILLFPNIDAGKSLTFLKQDFIGYKTATYHQLSQIQAALLSTDAMRHMTKRFDLINRYGLAGITSNSRQEELLRDYYYDRIRIGLTHRAVFSVSMMDTDPLVAKQMVDELVYYADNFVEKMVKRKSSLQSVKQSYESLSELQIHLRDSANRIRERLGIFRLDNVSDLLTPEILKSKAIAQNYDRLLSLENMRRDLEIYITEIKYDIAAREEQLHQHPALVEVPASGIEMPIVVRPKRAFIIIGTILISTLSITVIIIWLSEWFGKYFSPASRSYS